ncbi:MAG TPA: hypothetical protein VGE09_08565 [Pseudoxanthomonas sp.]
MQKHSRICYARDGAGNFSLPYPDFVAGTTIESAQVDANNSDIATALTASIAKDGQTVPSANLPMGGFKHTGVAVASARTDYARADQVIGSVLDYAADTGTATAYAIAPTPGITAYVVGQRFAFKAANANSGADPTLAVNSLTAGIVYWPNGASLIAGEIPADAQVIVQVATVTTGTPTFHLQSATKPPLPRTGGTLTGTLAMSGAAINEAVRVDVASAATCNIGAAASNYVRITGTTGITAFDTVASGIRRSVVFDDALTITHNGTSLILKGGANITTVAGDTAEFVSEGSGNWRCLDYRRATGLPLVGMNRAYAEYTTYATLATNIPSDDTIPQVGEGNQILSASITPRTTSSRIRARVQAPIGLGSGGSPDDACMALFRNGGADAIAATFIRLVDGSSPYVAVIEFEDVPASVSAQTYTVRVGANSASVNVNGVSGGRKGGGISRATIVLEEVA